MTYSKQCKLNISNWAILFMNITNFLESSQKQFYILNDALMFGNSGGYGPFVENRNYEFFCEFGFILHQLYTLGFGDKVFTILPYKPGEERESLTMDYMIRLPFVSLASIYNYNFGEIDDTTPSSSLPVIIQD